MPGADGMMSHDAARDLAAARLDGAIDPDSAASLEAHLAACTGCRAAVEAMDHDATALSHLPRLDAPARIRSVVVTSVGAAGEPRAHRWADGAVIASLAAFVVAGALLLASAHPGPLPTAAPQPAYAWAQELPAGAGSSSLTLTALARHGSESVALGSGPNGARVWRSAGGTWTAVAAGAFAGAQVAAATSTADGFVAVGYAVGADGQSSAVSWFSRDGATWQRSPPEPILSRAAMTGVTAIGSGIVAVGLHSQPEAAAAWRSSDGLHWSAVSDIGGSGGARLNCLAHGSAGYVGVGQDAAGAAVWWSADGSAFQRLVLTTAEGTRLLAVIAGGPGFVAVGSMVDPSQVLQGAIWTSTDGRTWQADPTDAPFLGVKLSGLTTDGARLTAVGTTATGAVAFVSLDGVTWQALPAGPGFGGAAFSSVLDDGSRLLVAGRGRNGPGLWRLDRPSADPGQ